MKTYLTNWNISLWLGWVQSALLSVLLICLKLWIIISSYKLNHWKINLCCVVVRIFHRTEFFSGWYYVTTVLVLAVLHSLSSVFVEKLKLMLRSLKVSLWLIFFFHLKDLLEKDELLHLKEQGKFWSYDSPGFCWHLIFILSLLRTAYPLLLVWTIILPNCKMLFSTPSVCWLLNFLKLFNFYCFFFGFQSPDSTFVVHSWSINSPSTQRCNINLLPQPLW